MSVPLSCLFFQLSVRTERLFPLSHECGMCTLAEGPSGLLPLSTDASSLHLKKGQSPAPGASSAHTFFPAGPVTSTCRHAVRVDRVWALGSERSASEHSLRAYHMVPSTKGAKMKTSSPSLHRLCVCCKHQNRNLIGQGQKGCWLACGNENARSAALGRSSGLIPTHLSSLSLALASFGPTRSSGGAQWLQVSILTVSRPSGQNYSFPAISTKDSK